MIAIVRAMRQRRLLIVDVVITMVSCGVSVCVISAALHAFDPEYSPGWAMVYCCCVLFFLSGKVDRQ